MNALRHERPRLEPRSRPKCPQCDRTGKVKRTAPKTYRCSRCHHEWTATP